MKTQTKEAQAALNPVEALEVLKKGNERFQTNLRANRNLLEQVNATSDGQYPFAVILSCIDSRTSAELLFDQGLGDIFSIRIAGNILNDDILGSMEFACKLAASKLIVVLGHSACGAVKGTCDGAELGHLTGLLRKIEPAMELPQAREAMGREEYIQRVAENNVALVVAEIRRRSPVLEEMIAAGEVGIVGGMYSVESGEVHFQDLVGGSAE